MIKEKKISCGLDIEIYSPEALEEIKRESLSEEVQGLLTEAEEKLEAFNESMMDVIAPKDISIYVIKKEAVSSAEMEGIHASLDDLLHEESQDEDALKTFRLERAYHYGLDALKKIPLSMRLLKDVYSMYLYEKEGETSLRRHQSYEGKSLGDASFIYSAPEDLQELMENWEEYVNKKEGTPDLLQMIKAYEYFLQVSPFDDSNGILARIFIPLFLQDRKLLRLPLLEISSVLYRKRKEQQEALEKSRVEGGETFIQFFLEVLNEALEQSMLGLKQLKFFFEGNPNGKG